MKVSTIGFTQKSAKRFFELVMASGAKRIVDVRLNNVSQLAGFAKKQDLIYFLDSIARIEYVHLPSLAPTQEMLDEYRKDGRDWDKYEERFLSLMAYRKVEVTTPREMIDQGCLLCSEHDSRYCHRRLVAEYLRRHWGPFDIEHLK